MSKKCFVVKRLNVIGDNDLGQDGVECVCENKLQAVNLVDKLKRQELAKGRPVFDYEYEEVEYKYFSAKGEEAIEFTIDNPGDQDVGLSGFGFTVLLRNCGYDKGDFIEWCKDALHSLYSTDVKSKILTREETIKFEEDMCED